jgi:tetratricopeptide (TPR) repeat protein
MLRQSSSILAFLLLTGAASGQAIVLKDGSRLPQSEFTLDGNKIIRTVKIGASTATSELPWQNISHLDWPEPPELQEARDLMAQAKSEEALSLLKETLDYFQKFEKIQGNWYQAVFFAYVETLSQAGRFEDTIKAIPQLRALPLTDVQKMALRIIQLDIDRQVSTEYASILAEARSILTETDDSSVGASIWMIIADIHAKKKEWETALMAYLRIPVFYGTQVQRVPDAELKAGQMLVKMKRFEDAQVIFTRVADSYQGSAIGQAAAKEKAVINGMKNEAEEESSPPSSNS